MVPWLPGGLGIVEAGGAGAFIFFGVQKSISISGVLIERLITFWFVIIIGILFGMEKILPHRKNKNINDESIFVSPEKKKKQKL